MSPIPPIPLPPPRYVYTHVMGQNHGLLDKLRVCTLCEAAWQRWQEYRTAHLSRRGGSPIAPHHLEHAGYLAMLFRAHVLQCRVVARSLGEQTTMDRCEAWNRWTRDQQQTQQYLGWQAKHLPASA